MADITADTNENVTAEITNAIESLCTQTQTSYVNFFDQRTQTPENLTRPIGSVRYIFPTGSFAFGEWTYGDDVHLVIFTLVSRDLTWSLLAEKVDIDVARVTGLTDDLLLSAGSLSRDNSGDHNLLKTFATLSGDNKAGCDFYLHYCKIPPSFDPATMGDSIIPSHKHARETATYNLARLCDTQFLAITTVGTLTTPAITKFREGFCILRTWMARSGLVAPRLGFFDAECITWIVCHALMDASLLGSGRTTAAAQERDLLTIILDFLRSKCSNTIDPTAIELDIPSQSQRDVSHDVTPDAKLALWHALFNMPLLPQTYNQGLLRFADSYRDFLIIEGISWNTTTSQAGVFRKSTVPRNVKAVMVYLRKLYDVTDAVKGPSSRLWAVDLEESEFQCKYAVGLKFVHSFKNDEALDILVNNLVKKIARGNVLDYPVDTTHITVTAMKRADLQDFLQQNNVKGAAMALSKLSVVARPLGERQAQPVRRFRPVDDAISRLRHDPAHSSVEYDLAYEDRFEGLIWMNLEDWGGKATEDKDFIPAHRVRRLRRREDLVVVWDRVARLDNTDIPGS